MRPPHLHRRVRRRKRLPPGTAPGTLHIDPGAARPVIRVIAFGPEEVVEREGVTVAEAASLVGKYRTTWINVDGLGDSGVLTAFEREFRLHRLALEDTVNTGQRPKVEEYPDQVFVVARMPSRETHLDMEQVSLFLGPDYVLSFQEHPGDCLDPVRARVRGKGPRLMNHGPDYLLYAILDAIIDAYFPVMEELADYLEHLEERILEEVPQNTPRNLQALKRRLYEYRRTAWSFREVFNTLTRQESPLVSDAIQVFLRDCYDHTIQFVEQVDGLRETTSGLMELYLSTLSNRMNEVMKVLTIIATIFIPITFIAGIYGMNFDPGASRWNMPELAWRFGYPIALLAMAVVAAVMVVYFWRKGWLGPSDPNESDSRRAQGSAPRERGSGNAPPGGKA